MTLPGPIVREKIPIRDPEQRPADESDLTVSFVGAGSYAMGNLLPNIPVSQEVVFKGVLTSSGTSARTVAEKYGFEYCASSESDIFDEPGTNTVFITTRHDTHAAYVKQALARSMHVFVEKPLCMKEEELQEIQDAYQSAMEQKGARVLMVGFNRRFAPLATKMKTSLGDGPMSMLYRINAGNIPADSWIQDAEIGGGRIVGEVCHFIDFLIYLNGSLPKRVHAAAMSDPENLDDTITINLKFENGSIGTICYCANGSKALPKEYVEAYRGGRTVVMRDFRELEVYGSGKPVRKKLLNQDKGQKLMVQAFLEAARSGGGPPISFDETWATTMATFRIIQSLKTGESMDING